MDPLIKLLKIEYREFCSTNLSMSLIKDIFGKAGFKAKSGSFSNGARRSLVEEYYASENWEESETVRKLLQAIEYTLQVYYLSDEAKEMLRSKCRESGIEVEDKGSRIGYEGNSYKGDLFKQQFPAGLPFGVLKPDFAVKAEKGGQTLKFELQSGIGIITDNVYPNFDFKKLEATFGLDSATNRILKRALVEMNQTQYEKVFFSSYAKKFDIGRKSVPMLIPQAWIQWHSQPKHNLRSASSLHKDDLYRVDFVAFWKNQRYVILVDDISHYAAKHSEHWIADEDAYAKRLKEDRKLRKEKWHVFRVSNWELKNTEIIEDVLEDLRTFIGFARP